jgi:CheY-like chemotaxis protein
MPKDSAIPTTPKSATTILREADDSVALLRARANGKTVGLFGFSHPSADPIVNQMGKLLETSVRNFLTKWYGLEILSLSEYPEIIVANETDQAAIADLCKDVSFWPTKPSILVLCSHSSRLRNSISELSVNGNMAVVAKPIGPLKLARALRQCLDTVPVTNNLGCVSERSVAGPSDTNDLSNVFEDLLISPRGGEVLDNSRMATDSDNARKAIESATPNALVEKAKEFPFPPGPNSSPSRANDFPDSANGHPSGFGFVSQQPPENEMPKSRTNAIQSATISTTQSPKLLLVDDNMINLKLLRHFITRLGYKTVDEADNGLEAVKKVEERPEGYDVIFMDISMPVLDGFGATREIRRIESTRHENAIQAGNIKAAKKAPALVIALTGLAGKNDQEEARECGVDLFLTKPVALKEVKKMLENWQSNQG